jgi:hypothetical protein
MSSFVGGLVRRGAGLPQPVAVRPAAGPGQLPSAMPAAVEQDLSAAAQQVASIERARDRSEVSERPVEIRERTTTLEPRSTLPHAVSQTDAPVPAAITHTPKPSPQPDRIIETRQPSIRETAPPPSVRPEPRMEAMQAPVIERPVPRPELDIAGRVPPAPVGPKSTERTKAPETRDIQVKIGKVEIRSSQPAPAARPAPPVRASGFDHLRLARTYLDRSRW